MSTGSLSSRITLPLFFGILFSIQASAQILQTAKWEKQSVDNAERHKIANLQEEGLMLYRRAYINRTDQLELTKLDTALHENWRGSIPMDPEFTLMRAKALGPYIYLLFRNRNFIGGDFKLLRVSVENGNFLSYVIKNLIPFNPTEFVITPQAALIGGYFNYRPIVLHFSFHQGKSKVLPGFFNSPGELNQLKPYEDGSIDIIVSAKNFEKRRSLLIRNYDAEGELIKTVVLQPEEHKHLLFGRSVKLADGNQVVAGVYGRYTEFSRGIFVAGIDSAGGYTITYYNFAQLQNFFSYMKANRQRRVKERIDRKTIRGKKVRFNYRVLMHELIPYQDQYIMTGEAFYPHYVYPSSFGGTRVNAFSSAGAGTNPFMRSDVIFDGYQYTHAVVIGFDKNGKLKWDNSFEINDVKSMQLEQYIRILPEKDRIILMYLFDNAIRTKIIRGSEVLEGKTEDQVRAVPNQGKKGKNNAGNPFESEQLDYWYGKYFFAYGIQKAEDGSTNPLPIYFINKISYE